MAIVGLTGSIGMGKTTAANMLRRLGLPVFDADAVVHALQRPDGAALPAIARAFPGLVKNGALDRDAMAECVFTDPKSLHRLEEIVHPLVRTAEKRFLRNAGLRRADLVVLEIPLLFENDAERRCDFTIVVTAPPFVQQARVLRRPGMTPARLQAVLAKQTPDAEKRKRADFIVPTGMGRHHTLNALREIVRLIRRRKNRRTS
ncbi:MAG: dephospho-CoA kinase [Alphaproteobacteria bacterium]|nr:dephospho-CoA kinase [Alphaproteobacteria bacterium]